MLVALLIAQHLRLKVEPFGAKSHQVLFRRFCRRTRGGCLTRRTPPQHRANARHQLAQFAGFCDVLVGGNLVPDHPVYRTCGGGQHEDRDIGAAFQVPDNGKTIFLGHVQIEHHKIGHAGFDRGAQALPALAQRHAEAVHLQVIPDHLAGRRLVIDNDDVLILRHGISVPGSITVNVEPCPGPPLSAVTWPPCISIMRLTIESPSPVELSPAVGFAESRWKRPNKRPRSSGDRPAPSSVTRIAVFPPCCVTSTVIFPPIGLYLMALLMRLSMASRIRSASHIVTKFGGAETVMVCCLLSARGWLASATSLTRPAISTGSRRMEMSKASAIASEIR